MRFCIVGYIKVQELSKLHFSHGGGGSAKDTPTEYLAEHEDGGSWVD
jgi:hypothetical protein